MSGTAKLAFIACGFCLGFAARGIIVRHSTQKTEAMAQWAVLVAVIGVFILTLTI